MEQRCTKTEDVERVQRYQCLRCKKTFNETLKFGEFMHYQAAKLYFTEESSYRAVGRQLGITPLTAFRWIDEVGGKL